MVPFGNIVVAPSWKNTSFLWNLASSTTPWSLTARPTGTTTGGPTGGTMVITVDCNRNTMSFFYNFPLHSGPNQGFLSNGYIIKYFLKFLKNIFMLTKIFEETLHWLVKILKTDQQWRSLWTSIPISMDLLRPQCNTRRPQCNTRHPQCNVCMSKCQQRWTLECWAALTTTTALLAFIIMPELSNVLLVNVDFIKTILSCRCYNACTFHVNKTMYGAKLSLYYHYRNSSDGS